MVDSDYHAVFDALKTRSLPPPSNADYELVWQGRITGDSAILYWQNGSAPVGLVRPGARADNLTPLELQPGADPDEIADGLKQRLGGRQ